MFKERPMLFSAPMAVAIDERRKTQTRRAIKDQKKFQECYDFFNCDNYGCAELQVSEYERGFGLYMGCSEYPDEGSEFWKSPYGKIGDRLWVKENYRTTSDYDHLPPQDIPKTAPIAYLATEGSMLSGKIRPNIFMCRWMSRFLLEITDILVQRVQDICASDCLDEGIDDKWSHKYSVFPADVLESIVDDYRILWNSINGEPRRISRHSFADISWKANPWVWALTFKRI